LIISRVSRVIIYSTLKTAYRRSKDIKRREKINFIEFSAKRSNAYEIEKGLRVRYARRKSACANQHTKVK
jgi:hypothetical protein